VQYSTAALPQRQQRAMENIYIKRVHFDPEFEAAEEERSNRRLIRQKEEKVGRDCHWLMAESSSVVLLLSLLLLVADRGLKRHYNILCMSCS
jgi:hypothetical protein